MNQFLIWLFEAVFLAAVAIGSIVVPVTVAVAMVCFLIKQIINLITKE